jgi:fumarate reductase flavoprotein subunit
MTSKVRADKVSQPADLVIVGAGGAGLAAAAAAVEKGLRVIVLEKSQPGGSTARAVGFFAAESIIQKRALIYASRDKTYRIAMEHSHLRANPRIIRAFVDKSADTVDWLMRKGVSIDSVTALHPAQYPATCHLVKGGGARLINLLKKYCLEMGVQILMRTPAAEILRDDGGHIIGVLARREEGNQIFPTRNVILASGGFGGNRELLQRYCPDYHSSLKHIGASNMGDGLEMALSMGAATEGLGVLHLAGPYFDEKAQMEIEGRKILMPLAAVGFEPVALWVNARGERFIDEAVGGDHFESANAVIRQPEMVAYMIIDGAMISAFETQGLEIGQGRYKTLQRRALPGLMAALLKADEKGNARVAESLDDIAAFIGADPEVLNRTVQDYNLYCDTGHDPVFAKNRRHLKPLRLPPFVAMKGKICFLGTIGGIKINHQMQVLDIGDEPIPGLYAAGSDTGGWTWDSYCGKLPGTTFGFALNSGRIAAETAAYCLKSP